MLKDKISFPFDIESIINDWILMLFLVGNSYIPHLPNLHINSGALDALQLAYMEILPTFDGYMNEAGTLKLDRFEKFMEKLSQGEADHFVDHLAHLKDYEDSFRRRQNKPETISYRRSKDCPKSFAGDSDNEMNTIEFVQHKRDYYTNKLGYENVDADVLRSQVERKCGLFIDPIHQHHSSFNIVQLSRKEAFLLSVMNKIHFC